MKAKHIGIIACSYEGASLCYQNICRVATEHFGDHPEVSLHCPPFQDYMDCINADNWSGVAKLMNTSAKKLISLGAEILICPDNTIHQVFVEAKEGIDTKWLNIAEEVAKVAKENKYRKIGVLGTKYLMRSHVYPKFLTLNDIKHEIPNNDDQEIVNNCIFSELVNGIFTKQTEKEFIAIIEKLKLNGCDVVILGCTEIPFIINSHNSPLPVLDSNCILAEEAVGR